MVQSNIGMKSFDTPTAQFQPGLISTLRAGFETVANHLVLTLFPIALDLFIWLGPRYRLKNLIQSFFGEAMRSMGPVGLEASQPMQLSKEFWNSVAEQLNLTTFLRTFPVGIPSLMASRSPAVHPMGIPSSTEITSPGVAILLGMIFLIIGLGIGTFYYNVTAQAALAGRVNWLSALIHWPWSAFQVFMLAVFWVLLFIFVSIPSSCILLFMTLGNSLMAQIALLIYFSFLLWLFLPLFFSAHGIIIYRLKVKDSIQRSVQITRWSLPMTGLFFLCAVLISQGLDIVWSWPAEDSWFAMIGVVGHGLVTSALLAASFIYYRQMDVAIQKTLGLIPVEKSNDRD